MYSSSSLSSISSSLIVALKLLIYRSNLLSMRDANLDYIRDTP